ncbi:MAG TPA: four helix bundle protein [Chitinophagaceae bacterium]|nr:four helix bundle protein [Chitinophagaceae bacterium]HAN39733.1 four helix bundle protein [Chitinophagaceae bacterium]
MEKEIRRRCYLFSLETIKFLKSRQWDQLSMILVRQLLRSATSIGANVVEAKNSSSRLEFKRFYEIALKSANETLYWLNLLKDGYELNDENLSFLLKEADELTRILAVSVLKLKQAKG